MVNYFIIIGKTGKCFSIKTGQSDAVDPKQHCQKVPNTFYQEGFSFIMNNEQVKRIHPKDHLYII